MVDLIEAMEAAHRTSLGTDAARVLATTRKTRPQMQAITSRWLLRVLPWVEARGGVYRNNRRLVHARGDARVEVPLAVGEPRVPPGQLRALPALRHLEDEEALRALADRFEPRQFGAGEAIVERGRPADQLVIVLRGKVELLGLGRYGDAVRVGLLADGDHFGDQVLVEGADRWPYTALALVPTTALRLTRRRLRNLVGRSEALRAHLQRVAGAPIPPQTRHGEAPIARASGHVGEPILPRTFVDYERAPREYELSLSQTVLGVHTRVSDLYRGPMDQLAEQLRLTIEALREEQEHQIVNDPRFGLLHNTDLRQRVSTRSGPPTPDDLDELLVRRRKTRCFIAHSRAVAAFHRQCNRRGIAPEPVEFMGKVVPSWRGVPILSCSKIPIAGDGTTQILAMRLGEDDQGVIGLHRTGIPEEREPGLNVRLMGVDRRGVAQYLVTSYYSVAVLLPDALGVLENVEVGR